MEQCFVVILIHVVNDASFGFAKGISDQHCSGIDPVDLSKPADETRPLQADSIKREVVGLKVG